jgi:hypothetical protein
MNLTREDVQRLTPVLVNIKFNKGCGKAQGSKKWKSMLELFFHDFIENDFCLNLKIY